MLPENMVVCFNAKLMGEESKLSYENSQGIRQFVKGVSKRFNEAIPKVNI